MITSIKTPKALLVFCMAILAAIVIAFLLRRPLHESFKTYQRRISYTLSVSNKSNTLISDAEVLLFSPFTEKSHQKVEEISYRPNPSEVFSQQKNSFLRYRLTLPPYGSTSVSVESVVQLNSPPPPEPLDDEELYLDLNGTDEELIKFAAQFSASELRDTATNASNWISMNLERQSYRHEYGTPERAFKERRGDCTEFAELLTVFLRANKIPARTMAGFFGENNGRLRFENYHNWVEFYDTDRWRIVDPFKELFDGSYESYITFQVLDGKELRANKQMLRFGLSDSRLTAKFQ